MERRVKNGTAGQFIRYLIAGGIGAAIELALFALLASTLLPALRGDEWLVRCAGLPASSADGAERAVNFALCMAVTFVVSNLAVYFLNAGWVFGRGRHGRRAELILFYATALLGTAAGTGLGSLLIARCGASGAAAYLAACAAAVLFNFAARKFVVFKP